MKLLHPQVYRTKLDPYLMTFYRDENQDDTRGQKHEKNPNISKIKKEPFDINTYINTHE